MFNSETYNKEMNIYIQYDIMSQATKYSEF